MKLHALLAAAALSAGLCAGASAQITGTVLLDGEAPEPQEITMSNKECAAAHADPVFEESIVAGEKGELANVVISIQEPKGKGVEEVPKEPVVLDQVGCQYTPHVVAMMVGQEFVVKNGDPFLHNVHTLPLDNEGDNFGQPNKDRTGRKLTNKIKVAERFIVKCDVHPWMVAHINAFEHPYFAVSKADGTFSLPTKGLEDGTYTLEIWHEKLAAEPITQEVEVKGGKAKLEEIKIPADAAEARADDEAEGDEQVVLAAAADEAKGCKLGGECCESKAAKKSQAVAKGD